MRIKLHLGLALLLGTASPLAAQAPLSAIDWLSDSVILSPVSQPRPPRNPAEDIATSALPEAVTVRPLDAPSPDTVGLSSARRAGLPADLWGATSSRRLAMLLAAQTPPALPALRDLLHDMLIAELDPPADSVGDNILFLARVDALLAMGALPEAAELLDRAGRTDPEYFRRWFDISLLLGTENTACARMRALPQISPTYAARIFCLARGGDWQAAAVTLESAQALGLVGDQEDSLLGRFLLAELSDEAPPLPTLRAPSPLEFAMYAAVGEPISTTGLPIAFAHSDLRPVTGWKARIGAAERLARAGAIDGARLFEVYGERKPAASGGVWDRVGAVQALAAGLNDADPDVVSSALPAAWAAMEEAGLQVALAEAITDALDPLPLSGRAQDIQLKIGLLSPDFAAAAARGQAGSPEQAFWLALAQGEAGRAIAPDPVSAMLRDGFRADAPSAAMQAMLDQGRKAEAVLQALDLFQTGGSGNLADLPDAVAVLRAVGLERVARQAALHLLILGPQR